MCTDKNTLFFFSTKWLYGLLSTIFLVNGWWFLGDGQFGILTVCIVWNTKFLLLIGNTNNAGKSRNEGNAESDALRVLLEVIREILSLLVFPPTILIHPQISSIN